MARQYPLHEIVLPWNGQTAFCRGRLDGLPVFGWRGRPGAVPPGLATFRQLRAVGLRPGGADPVALLVFRHRKAFRREEVCSLWLVAKAKPVRPMTARKQFALEKALAALRFCPQCRQDAGYRLPTSYGKCWNCFTTNEIGAAA
ncbi:hypothetical protein M8C13_40360 [Crossiella sp. SN42]|uniref:RRQRL motif-containing zinc-binding protein n=1 Tax=Crossiella sp. SN42 TaxID=2944808 RepID=UPI00207C7EEE|nr:RRQRL motif-containing zinc-binding protein [Crossiella sp. SN42]MCO1582021.1 hypothetical protein [Crossiella sp. SN42]